MAIVPKLTARIVREAPFATGNSYYLMEGRSRRSLRGFGVRVYRTKKEYVVRYRGRPHTIGRTDLIPLRVAREEARKLLLALLCGPRVAFSRKTVEELASDYLRRHARPHKAPRSAREDERMWRLYVLPALGDRRVHEITSEQLQDLHVAMAETPFAANRVLALLSKAFNLAELWGWRERGSNPTRGIQRYPEPARRRHLTSDEFRRLGEAIAKARSEQSVTPGTIGFLQTAGELLNFHPHVHVLVTDGGFAPDGAFRPLAWFHSQHVERLFRAEVLRMLLAKELITEAVVDNLLSWRHSGFSAHGAVRVEDRPGAVRLGRYMIRCPIVLKRLSWQTEAGQVAYRGRPSRRSGPPPAIARWDVLEFLARVVDHIPEPSQQMVRYCGYYANAARGKRRKAAPGRDGAQAARGQDEDEFTQRARLSWAKLIHRVDEVDPLLCPFCGAEMKILAFVLDFGAARAIRKSLKLPAQDPEPLAHAPPEALEPIAESA